MSKRSDGGGMNEHIYRQVNPRDLEPHFSKHMTALTKEDVRTKAEVAAELAARDAQIDALLEALEEITEVAEQVDSWSSFPAEPIKKAYSTIAKAKGEA